MSKILLGMSATLAAGCLIASLFLMGCSDMPTIIIGEKKENSQELAVLREKTAYVMGMREGMKLATDLRDNKITQAELERIQMRGITNMAWRVELTR